MVCTPESSPSRGGGVLRVLGLYVIHGLVHPDPHLVPEKQEADVDREQGRVRAEVECAVTAKGGLERKVQVLPRKSDDNYGAAV